MAPRRISYLYINMYRKERRGTGAIEIEPCQIWLELYHKMEKLKPHERNSPFEDEKDEEKKMNMGKI